MTFHLRSLKIILDISFMFVGEFDNVSFTFLKEFDDAPFTFEGYFVHACRRV